MIDARLIGNELGVATIVQGSVRTAGKRLRISAQLIRTDNGFLLWSENFDRELEDVFALQDELSLRIADNVRENFGHISINQNLVEATTQNVDAYHLYLKARFNQLKWDQAGLQNGIQFYKQSIELDKNFALAYFGLGFCYAIYGLWAGIPQYLQKADGYLKKGYVLDSKSPMSQYAMGVTHVWGFWEFQEGVRYHHAAIALNPSFTEAEEGLSEVCVALGLLDKATEHIQNALLFNPLSVNHRFSKAHVMFIRGKYEEALELNEFALQLDPTFTHSIALKQMCLIVLKQKDALEKYIKENPTSEAPEGCNLLYTLMNEPNSIAYTSSAIESILSSNFGVTLFPWKLILLTHLKRFDEAMDVLEEGVKNRLGQYLFFQSTPLLYSLHKLPRFKALQTKVFGAFNVIPISTKKKNPHFEKRTYDTR